MKAFVLQMTSSPNVDDNLGVVEQTLAASQELVTDSVVILPECFAYFGGSDKGNADIAEVLFGDETHRVQSKLAEIAKTFSIYLVAGTFPIVSDEDKVKPITLVYNPNGELIEHYQKIHLFDVDVADSTGSYRESDSWQAGSSVKYFDTPWGRIGLAICYDLRFPGLFQQLAQAGCKAVVLPSAFTQRTGEAHWHVLIRARAIENQLYMLACGQTGTHANKRETYGHSMIVDPWGKVLVDAEKATGLFGVELNMDTLKQVRGAMPIQQHNKFKSLYKD